MSFKPKITNFRENTQPEASALHLVKGYVVKNTLCNKMITSRKMYQD